MFRIALLLLSCCSLVINGKVCQSMKIKNTVESLEPLRNCTEIAGYIQILVMENVQRESDFDGYVFPELTTISGYLMFYSVYHLPSVAKLFPNLRVIRGMELFTDYALVLHEMPHLREIGTEKLMFIARGLVKVDKCPHLCFVDTIDWKKIGADTIHFNNMNNGTCDACPANCKGYCWNSVSCQITDTENCHIECLGCSKFNSADHCFACKNYNDNGTCVDKCPPNKYIHNYVNKCVTEEECSTLLKNQTWWVHETDCVSECPQLFERIDEKGVNKTKCKKCDDKCVRHCKGRTIDSMEKLQKFRGCTHVDGSLVLKFSAVEPSSLSMELEEHLGSIKHINGSLTVARTNQFTSLDFLRNLTYIGGYNVDKYSIFMYENQNLQKLWDVGVASFNLTIRRGTIRFHNNPLLCVAEIEKLANRTGVHITTLDVSPHSNGDKTNCYHEDMEVSVKPSSTNATLKWKELPSMKCTNYVGFTIYYKVQEHGEASFTDSKDNCMKNEWTSLFTTNNSIILNNLDPNSRYAYYIKIYCVSQNTFQSTMMYFSTSPDDPDIPEDVVVTAIDHSTIRIEWKPPLRVNGVLAYYKIDFNEQPDEMLERNYCEHPRTTKGDETDKENDNFDMQMKPYHNGTIEPKPYSDNCTCVKQLELDDMTIQTMDERFELCDLFAQSKFKKDDCKHFLYRPEDEDTPKVQKRDDRNNSYSSYTNPRYVDANKTAFNITNLKNFTLYIIYFSACNYPKEQHKCSSVLMYSTRTKKKIEADDVEMVTVVEDIDYTNAKITWQEPKSPNSIIVAYRIQYTKDDAGHSQRYEECIPRDGSFNGSQLILRNLSPGEYSITVQAESLAGPGRYSEVAYFTVRAPSKVTSILITSAILILTLIVVGSVVLYFWYIRKRKLERLIARINPDYEGVDYVEDEWEMDREDIDVQTNLGQGTFGTVFYGVIKSRNAPCAVKSINKSLPLHERMEFLNEASVMKKFSNCHHVVKLIGVVSKCHPPLVVMELMDRGDLKRYLRSTRDSSHNLTSNEIYRMAVEISDGMAYLAAKKFVHRDLAARNCMVAADRTVKIGDFGMARDIYETDYYRKGTKGLLPVRWMAPESLADGVFTSDSDVWSYGVVLWEIATLAEQPYQGLSNEQVLQFITSRGRMERPPECSDLLYEIMRNCWRWRPNDRPTFWDIVERLENHVSQDFQLLSFIHSREGLEHRIRYGRQRTFNAPALGIEPQEDLFSHYNVSDDEVSLHVGTAPSRPSFLEASMNPSRGSQFSSENSN